MRSYAAKDVKRLPALPAKLIHGLQRAGHISAISGRGQTAPFCTSDLLLLRIASALLAAGVPAKRIPSTLANIRPQLPIGPGGRALSVAKEVADSNVTPPGDDDPQAHQAQRHFEAALALENTDLVAARAGYIAALKAHRHHVESRINLGRLLHLDGQLEQAERIYRASRVASALLSFNLALLLEDMNREAEAVAAYQEALGLDPALHDAHFNLSRLHDRAQRSREALHHLLAYRRLTL